MNEINSSTSINPHEFVKVQISELQELIQALEDWKMRALAAEDILQRLTDAKVFNAGCHNC